MKHYFKIKTEYSPNGFIRIESLNDLEKAQYAFLTNAKVVFDNGEACRGQDIMAIKEDWHREMGWNDVYRDDNGKVREYELGNDDWQEIKVRGIEKKYLGLKADTKRRVVYLMENKKENLIGKGTVIDMLQQPKEILEGVKSLAELMKIK